MAKCEMCEQDMSSFDTTSCCAETLLIKGIEYDPIPYDPAYGEEGQRCSDCNVARYGVHHPGCCVEICPACDGQLISCGCMTLADQITKNMYTDLIAYVEWNGAMHEEDCPCDDTCECKGESVNKSINTLIKVLYQHFGKVVKK